MTAKQEILNVLACSPYPLAIHEIDIPKTSQTAVSARLRELSRAGIVIGERVEGKAYKIWKLASGQGNLFKGA